MISPWTKVEVDEQHSIIENCKSALSKKMDNIGLHAVIYYHYREGLSSEEDHEDTVATLGGVGLLRLLPLAQNGKGA